MGKNSKIDWTDHTWNPWHGCRRVSPGCQNCYMYREKKRYGQDPFTVVRSGSSTFNAPLKWKKPARVFTCSWSDFFIEDADPWRDEAWEIIRRTPHLTYLILTKRAGNIDCRLPDGWPWPNVWLGVTAENQEMADRRIPILLQIPAAVRFVSVEPMLGPIDLQTMDEVFCDAGMPFVWQRLKRPGINWIICGGESGPNARPMEEGWAMNLLGQCRDANVPFFMKQMSGRKPIPDYLNVREFPDK